MPSKIKKRGLYSKGGCKECKRRKVKCDEEKPQCLRCKRSNKKCDYPETGEKIILTLSNHVDKYQKSIPPEEESRQEYNNNFHQQDSISPLDRQNGLLDSRTSNSSSEISGRMSIGANEETTPIHSGPQIISDYNTSSETLGLQQGISDSNNLAPISTFVENFDGINGNDQRDLNVLASGLSTLVTSMVPPDCPVLSSIDSHDIDSGYKGLPKKVPDPSSDNLFVPRNLPIDCIKVTNMHEMLYLEEFYYGFAKIILPLDAYDTSKSTCFNPVRDILLFYATRVPYLMAATLAQGAEMCFKKNGFKEDKRAHFMYLAKCLKLLHSAISEGNEMKDPVNLTSNIEIVLLTVLLLTTSNASNENQEWRLHLEGAKDLLLKNSSSNSDSAIRSSELFIFCKFWFISFEILVGISSGRGGILKTNEEMDLLLEPGGSWETEVLKKYGVLREDGFNLLFGFHHSGITPFKNLLKFLRDVRTNKMTYIDVFELMDLVSHFWSQFHINVLNSSGIVTARDFDHETFKGEILSSVIVNGEACMLSWIDISHLSYTLASIISLLRRGLKLPYNSPHVQQVNKKLLSLVSFLKEVREITQEIKSAMLMIQWPMYVAGVNCIDEEEKFLITKLFRAIVQGGSGSSTHLLKKITRVWDSHSRNDDNENDIVGDCDNLDIVPY